MSDPIVYACILAALVLGWVACIVCWHRPDRANRAILHAAEVDDLREVIAAKDDRIEESGTRADVMESSAEQAWNTVTDLREQLDQHQRLCDAHTVSTERREWLPTIEGVGLDLIETLEVGWRLDWDAFDDGTPIGASVVESLAEVVPIGGLR